MYVSFACKFCAQILKQETENEENISHKHIKDYDTYQREKLLNNKLKLENLAGCFPNENLFLSRSHSSFMISSKNAN